MTFKFYIACVTGLIFAFITLTNTQPNSKVYEVKADETKECCLPEEKVYSLPPIYCYRGNEKSVLNVFQTIMVDLIIEKTDDFIIYQADDQYAVEEQMLSDEATLSLNKLISYLWRQKNFRLDPFKSSCFSIKTNSNFKIKIHSLVLDIRRLSMFIIGIFLFGYAAKLSHNSLFYYLCGITIGVFASFVIILFLISRLIPKKKLMIGFLGGSCMLSIYAIQMIIENLNMILMLYYKFILGYIIFSILVSFVVCYRYGPVTNPRSIDLIRWTLQLIGMSLVILCSFHLEAMVFVNILSIICYYTNFIPRFKFSKNMPKRRLLSDDEYLQQTLIETPKALEELQNYCKSPKCDVWKIVNKLHNPKKFAEFMETSAHISTEVVEAYENEFKEESESENSDSFDDIKEIEYTSDSE